MFSFVVNHSFLDTHKNVGPVISSARSSLRTRGKKVEEETKADIASPTKDSLKSPEESITSDTYEEDSSIAGKSGTDNGSGEDSEARKMYRLQRQKGKSRKTFRFRKGSKKGMTRNTEESNNTNKTDPDIVLEEDPNMISIDGRDSAQSYHQPSTAEVSQKQNVTTDQNTEIESKISSEDQQKDEDEQKEGQ